MNTPDQNKVTQTPQYYEKKDYLKRVGLKSRNVYKFLQEEMSEEEIINLDLIQTFRRYLHSLQNITLNECWLEEEEILNYRMLGFTSTSATKYVKKLKHVYKKDSTINWIFRIAESKINKDTEKQFEKYLNDIDETKKNNNNNNNNNSGSNRKKYSCSRPSGFVIFPNLPRNFRGLDDEEMPPRDDYYGF
jgi:hypothetical protein